MFRQTKIFEVLPWRVLIIALLAGGMLSAPAFAQAKKKPALEEICVNR